MEVSAPNLPDGHINHDRTYHFINEVTRKTIYWIFQKYCMCKPLENLETILIDNGWKEEEIEGCFNKCQSNVLKAVPCCGNCSVPLMCRLINIISSKTKTADEHKEIWENPETMEASITKLKDMRNRIIHGPNKISKADMECYILECENTAIELIQRANKRYDIPIDEARPFTDEINNTIKDLKSAPHRENELIKRMEEQFQEVICESNEEIKSCYEKWCKVVPIFFSSGINADLEVNTVFREMIVRDAGKAVETGEIILCKDLLQVKEENIILVEGLPGIGKSILLKYILKKWSSNDCEAINCLNNYHILIYFECRNRSIHSLLDLLKNLMSETVEKYSMVNTVDCISDLRVLFLIDELDELNEISSKVIQEIFAIAQKPNVRIICTSRPTNTDKLYKMKPSISQVKHLRLNGIPNDLHVVFVERLYKMLDDKSSEDRALLIHYIEEAPSPIKDYFRYPLNLTLITLLWIQSPEKLKNITTISSLYIEMVKLIMEELCGRLEKHSECQNYSSSDIREATNMVYMKICQIALADLKHDRNYVFDNNSVQMVKKFCSNIKCSGKTIVLPYHEIIEAFMTVKNTWNTADSTEVQYSYPHKSFQEHLAADGICRILEEQIRIKKRKLKYKIKKFDRNNSISKIFSSLKITDLHLYDDIFFHLIGLLALRGNNYLHHYGPGILSYIKNRCKHPLCFGAFSWWLLLLSESFNDEVIAEYVSKYLMVSWIIRDDQITSCITLLKYTLPLTFTLILSSHVKHQGRLIELVRLLATREKDTSVLLKYHFLHPLQGNNDDIATILFSGKCNLYSFAAHLTDHELIEALPETLEHLKIAITSPETLAVLNKSLAARKTKKHLNLEINIPVGMPLDLLQPLPLLYKTTLGFVGVKDEHIEWVVDACFKLQPPEGFEIIRFYPLFSYSDQGDPTAISDGISETGCLKLTRLLRDAALGRYSSEDLSSVPEGSVLTIVHCAEISTSSPTHKNHTKECKKDHYYISSSNMIKCTKRHDKITITTLSPVTFSDKPQRKFSLNP